MTVIYPIRHCPGSIVATDFPRPRLTSVDFVCALVSGDVALLSLAVPKVSDGQQGVPAEEKVRHRQTLLPAVRHLVTGGRRQGGGSHGQGRATDARELRLADIGG